MTLAVTSTQAILAPLAIVTAPSAPVSVTATRRPGPPRALTTPPSSNGAGVSVSAAIAVNVLAALSSGVVTAGSLTVQATGNYTTTSFATASGGGTTAALAVALGVAIAANVTIAALLAGPVDVTGNVLVNATATATTDSDARGQTLGTPSITVAGPLSLTVAINTTFAVSLAVVEANAMSVVANGLNSSSSDSRASASGVDTSPSPADEANGLVTDVASGLLGIAPSLLSLVPTDAVGAGLPVPPDPLSLLPGIDASDPLNPGGALKGLAAAAAMAINIEVSQTVAAVPLGSVSLTGPLDVRASGFSEPSAHADATMVGGGLGAATAISVGVAVIGLTAVLGGVVNAQGVTVRTLVRDQFGAPEQMKPVSEAFAGAGSTDVGAAGAFALSLSVVSSVAVILPDISIINAGAGDVVVYADANIHAEAVTDAGAVAVSTAPQNPVGGVGAAITITIAANVTVALASGAITTSGDVYVLAAEAPTGGPSYARAPTYKTAAFSKSGATASTGSVSAAVAIAVAANTTVAGLAAGTVTAGGDVFVIAAPDSTSTSYSEGASSGTAASIAGPISLTVALDLTLATSLSAVTSTGGSVTVLAAPVGNVSQAVSESGVTGVGQPTSPDADTLVNNWKNFADDLLETPQALLEAATPLLNQILPENLPEVPELGSLLPSIETPQGTVRAAAALAVNVEISLTVAAVLGGVTADGELRVMATGFSEPFARADATDVGGGVGAATAIAVDVAIIGLAAVLGGVVNAEGVSVRTHIAHYDVDDVGDPVPEITKPLTLAFAGAGDNQLGVSGAGAVAISVSVVTSVAAILPLAVVNAGSSDVVVYADASIVAEAITDTSAAEAVGNVNNTSPSLVAVGAAVTITVAINATVALMGGIVTTTGAGKVYVLASDAPAGGPGYARLPTYETHSQSKAGSIAGTAAISPAIAIAVAVNTTVAVLLLGSVTARRQRLRDLGAVRQHDHRRVRRLERGPGRSRRPDRTDRRPRHRRRDLAGGHHRAGSGRHDSRARSRRPAGQGDQPRQLGCIRRRCRCRRRR